MTALPRVLAGTVVRRPSVTHSPSFKPGTILCYAEKLPPDTLGVGDRTMTLMLLYNIKHFHSGTTML